MKLLLTSVGLSNTEISKAFLDLVSKEVEKVKVALIPTAALSLEETENVRKDKEILKAVGLKEENIVEFRLDHEVSYEEISEYDAIYVCGGNTFFLMNRINKMKFTQTVSKFLMNEKVYVGVSAGSIVVTPNISIANVEPADSNTVGLENLTGMGIVNFECSPHVPEVVSYENVEKYSETSKNKIYAFDHNTALRVDGATISFVGGVGYRVYN